MRFIRTALNRVEIFVVDIATTGNENALNFADAARAIGNGIQRGRYRGTIITGQTLNRTKELRDP